MQTKKFEPEPPKLMNFQKIVNCRDKKKKAKTKAKKNIIKKENALLQAQAQVNIEQKAAGIKNKKKKEN